MKLCRTCNTEKPFEAFSSRSSNKDGLQSKCKECHRAYQKTHYDNNKSYYIEKADKYSLDMAEFIRRAKEKPCADCGVQYEYFAMDFDHLGDKQMTLGSQGRKSGRKKIEEEILKCDVVCAVCHRYRTQSRFASVSPHPPKVSKA